MEDEEIEKTKSNKQSKKVVWQKTLYWVTVTALVAVIVWCLWQIIYKEVTDAQEKDKYETLEASKDAATTAPRPTDFTYSVPPTAELVEPDVTEPDVTVPEEPDEPLDVPEGMIKEYQLMYTLNNDMIGWIEIPGTSIDYPVVQSPYQTDFYLDRNFYKEHATCGTIYVRERCDVTKPSDNVTIYGHNMRNGTMFADLHEYEEKSFWKNNSLIYFDTLYEYHTYEIFAVFIIPANDDFSYHIFDDAANEADFDEFVSTCKELSLYDTGITPEYGEKLITLSTCDKSIDNGRLVVVARRIM